MLSAVCGAETAPPSVELERAALASPTGSAISIDNKFINAAAFALAGVVLTLFGFMHGEAVGIAVTPTVAVAYGIVAVFLYAPSRYLALACSREVMAATPAE